MVYTALLLLQKLHYLINKANMKAKEDKMLTDWMSRDGSLSPDIYPTGSDRAKLKISHPFKR